MFYDTKCSKLERIEMVQTSPHSAANKSCSVIFNMAWQACILSTWCFCNVILSQLVMHCPQYPPKVDVESRSASRIMLGNRVWNISAPQANLTVSSNLRARRSTEGM